MIFLDSLCQISSDIGSGISLSYGKLYPKRHSLLNPGCRINIRLCTFYTKIYIQSTVIFTFSGNKRRKISKIYSSLAHLCIVSRSLSNRFNVVFYKYKISLYSQNILFYTIYFRFSTFK
uniref:Uncharacterized protein n=1 Tax=Podoviridae sp. ct8Lf7 TaxID=2827723 RepID=A0A8S5S1E5_9CAUD|nr:MAG TPA: hypothetical protein [Podoviridae sp. ct8Lf7]